MEALDRLREHAAKRIVEIAKAKKAGTKVIGMTPGGFCPEEMVYAAGAIPLILGKGGDPEPCTESLTYAPRFMCAWCRSQIGYLMIGEAAEYKLPDLMVVPIVDVNIKVVADGYDYYSNIPSFRMGVPHERDENGANYYKYHLEALRAKLEEVTGNKITDEALKKEIADANKKRDLLREISFLRKGAEPVISSRDYVLLHQLSFYAEKNTYLAALEEIRDELVEARKTAGEEKHPRIMLIASTLGYGDRRIFEIVDETDAEIVFENIDEGMIPYYNNVELEEGGDVMDALVDCYFTRRIKGAWDRPWDGRFEDLEKFAQDFDVDGVIWYETIYRDGPDLQAWAFAKKFKAAGQSFVKIETDYTAAELGPMRTRLETFIELMQQGEADSII